MLCKCRRRFHSGFCWGRCRHWSPDRPLRQEIRSDLSAASDGWSSPASIPAGVEENNGSASLAFLLTKIGARLVVSLFFPTKKRKQLVWPRFFPGLLTGL